MLPMPITCHRRLEGRRVSVVRQTRHDKGGNPRGPNPLAEPLTGYQPEPLTGYQPGRYEYKQCGTVNAAWNPFPIITRTW